MSLCHLYALTKSPFCLFIIFYLPNIYHAYFASLSKWIFFFSLELLEDNIFPISIEYNRFGLADEFPDTLKNIVFEYVNEDPEDVDEYGSVEFGEG